MYCPSCGSENLQGAEDCLSCGSDLTTVEQPIVQNPLRRRLLLDTANNLFPYKALLVNVGDSVAKAVRLMQEHRYGCVMVMDGAELVGIFTERDVLYKIARDGVDLETIAIETVMTPKPAYVRTTDTLAHTLNLMSMGKYRHIPVVDEDGFPTGFLSVKGIFHYLCVKATRAD